MKKECLNTALCFFILLCLSGLVRYFYKKEPRPSTADGSIVMAIGIFSFDALLKLPLVSRGFTQLVTLELLIVWLLLVKNYLNQSLHGGFKCLINHTAGQFGIGTWVAGSSILALLFFRDFTCYRFIAWLCAFLAFIIWLPYLALSVCNLWLIVTRQRKVHIGIMLLATVSTQSIVLLTYFMFATTIPRLAYQAVIVLGYFLYFTGLFIIVRYLLYSRLSRIILGWHSTNSILHGALSISGLAAATTKVISDQLIIGTWFLATGFLLLVEGISVIKGIYRFRRAGFTEGILVYDVSQWARVFTLGMYYTFNLSLITHQVYVNPLIQWVAYYGQYGVLGIVLFELVNYFYYYLSSKRIDVHFAYKG